MQYHISIADQHSFNLSAKDSPDGEFIISDTEIDLSSSHLFMDPSRRPDLNGGTHSLVPLGKESLAAFEQLKQVQGDSVILSELKKFSETKLTELLEEVAHPVTCDLIDTTALALPDNQKIVKKALRAAVKQIDKELPHYFRAEKELGTFNWLASGGENTLPFNVSGIRPFSREDAKEGDVLLLDMTGRFVEFDITKKTAHVLADKPPTAAELLDSLCNSGTLGRSVLELNRGAILHHVAKPGLEMTEFLKEALTGLENLKKNPPPSLITTAAIALAPCAAIALILGTPVIQNIISNTLTVTDIIHTGLVAVYATLTAKFLKSSFRMREKIIAHKQRASEADSEFEQLSKATSIRQLNVLASAILDQLQSRSAGNSLTTLAPKTMQGWQSDIPSLDLYDDSLIPTKLTSFMGLKLRVGLADEVTNVVKVEEQEDYSDKELTQEQVYNLSIDTVVRIKHIERAFETWNMFQAAALIEEFAERQNIPTAEAPRVDIKSTLNDSLLSSTDQSHTYPVASQAFSSLTAHFKINRETWNQIARALQSASTLERLHDSKRAQQIARQVLDKHFA